MLFLKRLTSAGRRLLLATQVERELDEELNAYRQASVEQKMAAGVSRSAAERATRLEMGSLQAVKDLTRDVGWESFLESTFRDVRYAARSLRRTPAFTLAACLTLALGMGASTGIFSVLNGVLLKPLPYPASEELVALWHTAPGLDFSGSAEDRFQISATQFFTYRDETQTLQEMGLWSTGLGSVTGATTPEQVQVLRVTHGILQALQVRPALGRWFSQADDSRASPETVILAHSYWQRHFGGDSSILGRHLTVDARPRQVIGVMPQQFRFLDLNAELILPLRFDRSGLILGQFNYQGLGRLKPDATLASANADVARMIPMWLNAWPSPPGMDSQFYEKAQFAPALRPLKEDVVGDVRDVL
ncbi:MAG: ABC transporter permease, partial [Vicinamibacterales bacterium]